jgi:hypothetical protein
MPEPQNNPPSLVGNNTPPSSTPTTPSPEAVTPPAETSEAKPEGEAKPEATAPEALTREAIKLPEGMEADEPLITEFLGVLNNAELTPAARAQALIDLQVKANQAASEKNSQLWTETQEQWVKESRELPKIGGDKLDETLGNISRLVDEYGGSEAERKELRETFDLTGAGNHRSMIRFLHNVAQQLVVEGKPTQGNPTAGPRDAAAVLFPNQGKA